MAGRTADIRDVEHAAERQLLLYAETEIGHGRHEVQAHRAEYEAARQCFEDYVDDFIQAFRSVEDFEDLSAKDCVFRIYRDVRFAKDKSPYKPNMAASIALPPAFRIRSPASAASG